MTGEQLVQAYYDTLKDGMASFDEDRLRRILAPDLVFEGPIAGRHVGAEGFIKGVAGFAETMRGLTMLQQLNAGTRRPRSTTPRCPAALSASPSSSRPPTARSSRFGCSTTPTSTEPAAAGRSLMGYDNDLAERIRELLAAEPDLTEKKMFGGVAFLVRGRMAVAASSEGGIMVRVDPAESDRLVESGGAHVVEMRGRAMRGWVRVAPERLRSSGHLDRWVERGVAYARLLPPKAR